MTPEEIRITLAEANGYTKREVFEQSRHNPSIKHSIGFFWHNRFGYQTLHLPDYCHNVDACLDVVANLTEEQRKAYRLYLCNLCGSCENAIDATALQRCRAILHALGKDINLSPNQFLP